MTRLIKAEEHTSREVVIKSKITVTNNVKKKKEML